MVGTDACGLAIGADGLLVLYEDRVGGVSFPGMWSLAMAGETTPRPLRSIFFGGGTPSLADPESVAAAIERARARFGLVSGAEITLEANPTSVEAGRFAALAAAGVTRLSLGVQALDDAALSFLGRPYDRAQAIRAIGTAQAAFPRVSLDLIHSRPGQSPAAWRAELREALAFGTGHLSLYQLTIEPGTPFGERGLLPADEETQAALFDLTQEECAAAGRPAYEVSNHAAPGEECRHNLLYWQGCEWLGVGPGAHGRVGGRAVARIADPADWLAAVETQGHGTAADVRLDAAEIARERLMMGLRLVAGIDLDARMRSVIDPAGLARMIDGGFVTLDGDRLRPTASGWRLLDPVLATLLG
jgi:oxygen-independent coproporphyrinogen-3 oxidase